MIGRQGAAEFHSKRWYGWGWGFRAASQEAEGPPKTILMSLGGAEVMQMKTDLEDSKIRFGE